MRRVEGGEIEGRELLEKRRGTNASLYLAEEAGSDAIRYRTRRAVRVVTGPLHRMGQLTGTQIASPPSRPVLAVHGNVGK
jgi:hypothetical protein